MPVLVPAQKVGVLPKAFREVLLTEAFSNVGIGQVRLADKFRGRIIVFLLPPMDCDLSLGGFTHYLWFWTYFRHIGYSLELNQ